MKLFTSIYLDDDRQRFESNGGGVIGFDCVEEKNHDHDESHFTSIVCKRHVDHQRLEIGNGDDSEPLINSR